jgi:hypothetical protein
MAPADAASQFWKSAAAEQATVVESVIAVGLPIVPNGVGGRLIGRSRFARSSLRGSPFPSSKPIVTDVSNIYVARMIRFAEPAPLIDLAQPSHSIPFMMIAIAEDVKQIADEGAGIRHTPQMVVSICPNTMCF